MRVKEIFLEKEIHKDLGSRGKMEDLFIELNKENLDKVIFNFEDVEFMGRSVIQEYINQKNKSNFDIEERNISEEIQEFISIVIELNKQR